MRSDEIARKIDAAMNSYGNADAARITEAIYTVALELALTRERSDFMFKATGRMDIPPGTLDNLPKLNPDRRY